MTPPTTPDTPLFKDPAPAVAPDDNDLDLADVFTTRELAAVGWVQQALLLHLKFTLLRRGGASYGEAVQAISTLFGLSRRNTIYISSTVTCFLRQLQEVTKEHAATDTAALRAILSLKASTP